MPFNNRYSQRKEIMKQVASKLDLSFAANDEYGLRKTLLDFKLFREGHSRRIKNIMSEKDDWHFSEINLFDYHYVISAGNSHVPKRQTVFFLRSMKLALPQFYMRPENIFHKIGTWLGMQDINFEQHPVFSNQYLLKSEDEDRLRQTLDHQVLYFFTIEKHWYLEGLNYYMVFYKKNKLLKPEEIMDLYKKGNNLFEMLRSEE